MAPNNLLELEDLIDNPTPRVPVSLCLDCSGSMTGSPIEELNRGVQAFYNEINQDEIARYSAEINIVTFGPAQIEADFQTIDMRPNPPIMRASGNTPMGEAVKLSLDSLENRKRQYRDNGVDYYQPWLVLMSDGAPYGGSTTVLEEQIQRTCSLVKEKKLTVFAIGVGKQADMATLNRFSPNRTALRLQGLNFSQFFEWLSKSVSRVSQSTPGDTVKLDVEGIKGWADL